MIVIILNLFVPYWLHSISFLLLFWVQIVVCLMFTDHKTYIAYFVVVLVLYKSGYEIKI